MGKEYLNILVFEDSKKHAEEMVRSYERAVKAIENAIDLELRRRIAGDRRKNTRKGILLDVSLSKEEYGKASVNDYSGFTMARKIYEQFDSAAGIYIVTSIRGKI